MAMNNKEEKVSNSLLKLGKKQNNQIGKRETKNPFMESGRAVENLKKGSAGVHFGIWGSPPMVEGRKKKLQDKKRTFLFKGSALSARAMANFFREGYAGASPIQKKKHVSDWAVTFRGFHSRISSVYKIGFQVLGLAPWLRPGARRQFKKRAAHADFFRLGGALKNLGLAPWRIGTTRF
uniref:hypothetical protein n=1 Tax=Cephaleuros parasiticus TaxID=173370 RepID=UPI001EDFCD19|nr:hypothetical protein MFQ79_pgp095 [Cephaleuros parasiticus]UIB38967.1 hypothetical protein [Cephaleuros parasiticus]